MLELNNLTAGYGSFQALFSVNLEVKKVEAIAVIAVSYTHLTLPTILLV